MHVLAACTTAYNRDVYGTLKYRQRAGVYVHTRQLESNPVDLPLCYFFALLLSPVMDSCDRVDRQPGCWWRKTMAMVYAAQSRPQSSRARRVAIDKTIVIYRAPMTTIFLLPVWSPEKVAAD